MEIENSINIEQVLYKGISKNFPHVNEKSAVYSFISNALNDIAEKKKNEDSLVYGIYHNESQIAEKKVSNIIDTLVPIMKGSNLQVRSWAYTLKLTKKNGTTVAKFMSFTEPTALSLDSVINFNPNISVTEHSRILESLNNRSEDYYEIRDHKEIDLGNIHENLFKEEVPNSCAKNGKCDEIENNKKLIIKDRINSIIDEVFD